jgi:transposase InsO family protein
MHLKNTTTIGYLQMDVKYLTPELTGLPWTCFEYGIIDIYSRYKDAVILNHLDQDGSIEALLTLIPRLPFKPVFLQTDNGLEFQERFTRHVTSLSLSHHHIHKSTPNENAVIERSFRTDEDEFFFFQYKGAKDYDDLRAQYARYLSWYNTIRPHLGIQLKTPLQVVQSTVAYVMKD